MPVRTGKKSMKQVDTKEYISILRELTEEGRQVSLIISGNSMAPFLIHGRDTVWFEKPKRPLKRGDIVFFQRDDGSFCIAFAESTKMPCPKGKKGGTDILRISETRTISSVMLSLRRNAESDGIRFLRS